MMTRMISGLLGLLVLPFWFAACHAKAVADRFIGLLYGAALALQEALYLPCPKGK